MDKVNLRAFDSDITNKLGMNKLSTTIPDLNLPSGSLPNTGVNVPDANVNLPQTNLNTSQVGEIQQKANEITGAVSSVT